MSDEVNMVKSPEEVIESFDNLKERLLEIKKNIDVLEAQRAKKPKTPLSFSEAKEIIFLTREITALVKTQNHIFAGDYSSEHKELIDDISLRCLKVSSRVLSHMESE